MILLFNLTLKSSPDICKLPGWDNVHRAVVSSYCYNALPGLLPADVKGLYLPSSEMSYCNIMGPLEAAGLGVNMLVSLWYLTCTSAALPPRCMSKVSDWNTLNLLLSALILYSILKYDILAYRGPEHLPKILSSGYNHIRVCLICGNEINPRICCTCNCENKMWKGLIMQYKSEGLQDSWSYKTWEFHT